MLLLLPPSEGKAPARRGAPVDLDRLSWPALRPHRERVLDALGALCARPDAAAVLGVGPSLAGEVARNQHLRTAPARRASSLYSGVLFEALDLPGLPAPARRRAARGVVVLSALWGALRPGDAVPAYRLGMGVDLPGVGPLAAAWRRPLADALDREADGVVVDCRSSAYAAAWRPSPDVAERTAAVRVLRGGAVVSHDAKRTRGLVARHLLARPGRAPRTPQALAGPVGEAFDVELLAPVRRGAAWTLVVRLPA